MAIVENKASEIGDIITIRAEVPIVGLVTLASFTDSVVNESGTKFFTKEFRYSVDGINFSIWIPLTNPNIAAINVSPTSLFTIEYRYIRSGVDASNPSLEFNQVQVNGTFTQVDCGQTYKNSIFAQFFSCTDICVLAWMINVLEKLYRSGILPNYLDRGHQNNEYGQDQDFMEFWKTICQYFAYVVCYARKWELNSIISDYERLREYLENQTLIFCGSESIQDLIYIMNNTYDEIRHRGTYEIVKTKADNRQVDGEWHRLFCHLYKCTDWYFSLVSNYKIGWVVDQASPLYKGNYFDKKLTKGFEDGESAEDLANYPILNTGSISIVSDVSNKGSNISVIEIDSIPPGTVTGIGHNTTQVNTSELIKVSPYCEYEITFWCKMEDLDNLLTFGVNGYDENGNLIDLAFKLSYNSMYENLFGERIKFTRGDKFYFVRGIIYSVHHTKSLGELEEEYLPNGTKSSSPFKVLKFGRENICYISPTILLDNTLESDTSGIIKFYDIKVRFLRTNYSTGFEQPSGFIKMMVQNFNQSITTEDIEENIREFLIPYNTTFKLSYIDTNPKPALQLDEFDFMVVRYRWYQGSGTDMDTRTGITNTGDLLVDDNYVGWSQGSIVDGVSGNYLVWGGDETSLTGQETVLVNFVNLKQDYPSLSKINIDLRGFWYSSRNTGNIDIEFETFKGGTMTQVGRDFINVGGKQVNLFVHNTILTLRRFDVPVVASTIIGELLGTIIFDTESNLAQLIPK